jgi:hypothetical protein
MKFEVTKFWRYSGLGNTKMTTGFGGVGGVRRHADGREGDRKITIRWFLWQQTEDRLWMELTQDWAQLRMCGIN